MSYSNHHEWQELEGIPAKVKFELHQLRSEKSILLDQIAKFEIPVCFACREKIPLIERKIELQTDERLDLVYVLREKNVMANDAYNTELKRLNFLEVELEKMKSCCSELEACKINTENQKQESENNLRDLQKQANHLLKCISFESKVRDELKKTLEILKKENGTLNFHKDIACVDIETTQLKMILDERQKERNDVETELHAIHDFINSQLQKLNEKKFILKEMRKEANLISKQYQTVENELCKNAKKLEEKNTENEQLKLDLQELDEEIAELIKNEKQKIEESEEEKKRTRCELLKLGEEIKKLRSVLVDYHSQKVSTIDEIKCFENEIQSANETLENLKNKLTSITTYIQKIEVQRNISRELHKGLRVKLRTEFSNNRLKLDELRKENKKIEDEISRQSSPEIQEIKRTLQQKEAEELKLKAELDKKIVSVNQLLDNISLLENEGNIVGNNFEEKMSGCNEISTTNETLISNNIDYKENLNVTLKNNTLFTEQINKLLEKILKNIYEQQHNTQSIESPESLIEQIKNNFLKCLDENSEKVMNICDGEHLEENKSNSELVNGELESKNYYRISNVLPENQSVANKNKTKINSEIQKVENNVAHLSEKLNELKTLEKRMKENVAQVTKNLDLCKQKVQQMQEDKNELEAEKERLEHEISKKYTEVNKLKNELNQLSCEVQRLMNNIASERKSKTGCTVTLNQVRAERPLNRRDDDSLLNLAEGASEGIRNPYPSPKPAPETPE